MSVLSGLSSTLIVPPSSETATTIGLGIDFAAHFVHRFVDETIRGAGGALAGSMLTTTTGTRVLALAITPILGQFGLVIALSVFYSFLTSILVAPSVIVVWE